MIHCPECLSTDIRIDSPGHFECACGLDFSVLDPCTTCEKTCCHDCDGPCDSENPPCGCEESREYRRKDA
jgi:hypothetical protein